MSGLALGALVGSSPLGFLAALGAVDVAHRVAPDRQPTLRWTDELVPRAILDGPDSIDALIEWILQDLGFWRESALLGLPSSDIKPTPAELHRWAGTIVERSRVESDLFAALMAEGALAGNNASKPTHLHFTAGQQQFLIMVRSER